MAEREWNGQRFSADSFHIYYKTKFLGVDEVRLPSGKVSSIPRSTAELDATEFAEYFDKVQADAAQRGVWLADMESA
jgi:hypothetical protein